MGIDFGDHKAILLDCCSLLNLYATRRMAEILRVLPLPCVVTEAVVGEAIYVLRGGDGDDASEREPVELQPLIAAGILEIWRPETESEFASFVAFSIDIDDGEAATCALALHRGGVIVTDDRKTLRILSVCAAEVIALTTSQVLKLWAESVQIDKAILRATLVDIRVRARFVPGKQDPLFDWWEDKTRGP